MRDFREALFRELGLTEDLLSKCEDIISRYRVKPDMETLVPYGLGQSIINELFSQVIDKIVTENLQIDLNELQVNRDGDIGTLMYGDREASTWSALEEISEMNKQEMKNGSYTMGKASRN